MFRHVKQLQYTVRVSEPNPGLANLLLEQFGGPQGELAARRANWRPAGRTGGRLPLLHARFKR
ncbi:manganese catalase family protein [Salmonella enterica]|nr:manganese catalase family protein [Salmonella enterica]